MEQYIGEIRLFAGGFAPKGWALCNGQLLAIAQNTALYSLLGVQYGGDGKTSFALPNLQGRAPMGQGAGPGLTAYPVGASVGSSTVTLLTSEMPVHTHVAQGTSAFTGGVADPTDKVWGSESPNAANKAYATPPNTGMHPLALEPTGGSLPHNNMQPYLALNYIIALEGEFPQRQ